ncbi:helix-turn-helix transcriptional regulator [Halarcobacter sp.]|uniref:helix-turn-helix domain-containing protein n=1 Tax=Halarcobacter sp. TaxID=2321133 RepID=UPI002AAAD311|nr:helix-turn-helix transcriptional regulator [Halarcobacter sp.]
MKNIEDFNVDEFHKKIGNNVKNLREQKGLTQLELSHAIGHKSVSIISNGEIYHNKSRFNLEHLGKIAFVLDVKIEEFFK